MLNIASFHFGLSLGGVAQYAGLLEKVGESYDIHIQTLCVERPGRFVDTRVLQSLDHIMIQQKTARDFAWVKNAADCIDSLQMDAIMAHGYNGYVLSSLIKRKTSNKLPLLCSYHGRYHAPSKVKKLLEIPFNGIAEYILRNKAHSIVSVCHHCKAYLIDRGVPSDRIAVIHNGIASEPVTDDSVDIRQEFGIGEDEVLFGVVSRLDTVKGIQHLVEAFEQVVRQLSKACVVIAGSGAIERDLQQQVEMAGLSQKIIFTGFRADVDNLLSSMDVFVLPSLAEYHSIGLLEAMRAGLPSIVTDVGGNTESVRHGKEGLVVKPAAPAELAEAMTKLAGSSAMREQMGKAARQRFLSSFTDEIMIQKTAEWILSSLDNRKGSRV